MRWFRFRNTTLDPLQRVSLVLMVSLILLTFVAANLHAKLWQSSRWLVSTVLPAVIVELTNEERSAEHAGPLHRNSVLDEAARLKAQDMAEHQYFAHYSPAGVSPWHWFDEAGYVYAHAGENLAIHFTDSSEVVEAWMDSPKHRENIVNSQFTEIGVGTAKGVFDGYDTVYVVQLFGTPAVLPAVSEAVAVSTAPRVTPTEVLPLTVVYTETEAAPEVVAGIDSEPFGESVAVTEPKSTSTEPVLAAEASEEVADTLDVIVVETALMATSSGLAVATVVEEAPTEISKPKAGIATQPNKLLQRIYVGLALLVFLLLVISVAVETRRLHFTQAAYGVLLIFGMGGLWFIHSLLTGGAVVI
ncbi:MAG: CAP domain-containing protein [Patescibacteria group bacterium]